VLRKRPGETQQNRDALAEIQIAATTETDDYIGIEAASDFGRLVDRPEVHFGPPTRPEKDFGAAFLQQQLDTFRDADADDVLVRADHDPLAEFLVDVTKLLEHTPPEEDASRRRKSPRTLS